jgi:hypothetical protein
MKKREKPKRALKTAQIHLRLTEAHKRWLEDAWLSTNFDSLSAWIFHHIDQEAERLIGPKPKR